MNIIIFDVWARSENKVTLFDSNFIPAVQKNIAITEIIKDPTIA